jgi:hypothetical protein
VARPHGASSSLATLALALLGIFGGAVLLAAFVVDIPSDLNTFRLILFNAGAIAIVIAVHRRLAVIAPRLALPGAVPAVLANAWYLTMTVLAVGNPRPFAGEFGLVYFAAGLAMWLADAVFGLVALRLAVVARLGGLALAIGSMLAVTGMDRLGLTASGNPTIFEPISLVGIALNGIAWILLGLDLAMRSRGPIEQPLPLTHAP